MSKTPQYDSICDYKTLKYSYDKALTGDRKYRKEAIIFDMARERNLVALWRELKNETYCPGSYYIFEVTEPKRRRVSAPHIRDKIVQYAAHLTLWKVYEPVFIADSFACMEFRGAHRAVDKVQHYMRLCQWQHGDCWILKMDARKFFYSIDREVLKTLYRKKIKDEKFLRLLDMIIDSSPEGDTGIPLGNVTSQDMANIYLNEVDQFAKRYLGAKYYVRYMDDIIVMTPDRETAERYLAEIEKVVVERLHMELNSKTRIFPVAQGVNAYGFKIHTTHRQVRTSSKQAMKRRIKEMDKKYKNGEISLNRVMLGVNSWLGHARHSNSYNLAKKLFAKYDYIQVDNPKYKFGVRLDAHK
ncbi:MAG: reverse transcriptase/maturase family protein [Oscillospiraceae bacterium]|jgi:retron-type reverse transcriptase|nr:reverse transcriptase/maturase family protein [Oscillospiraceae bacterium]